MAQSDLRRVTRCAKALGDARKDLREAVIAARESGETLRDIGAAAGMSHQRIWQILNEKD